MTTSFKTSIFALALATTLSAGLALPAFAETVLYKGNGGEPQTLDSAHTSINVEEFVLKDLNEGLTVYDAYGKIVPGAAESWTLSPDGTVYTFKIARERQMVERRASHRRRFRLHASRVVDPKEAAGYANILYPIKNAEAINTGEMALDQLGVKAVDAKTLEITLERPTPYFLQLLSHQTALPVNKENYEKYKADFVKPGNMVSNGAFMLTENVANDHITMVKNPNYWDAANVKIDKVVSYPAEDQAAAQVRRFLAGEFDVNYNFQADQLIPARQARRPGACLASPRDLLLRLRHPQAALRRRPRAAGAFHGDRPRLPVGEDLQRRAAAPLQLRAAGHRGLHPRQAADFAGSGQLDREDKAAALLKEAGYGQGGKPLKIEIRYNTKDNHKQVATAVADMWKTPRGQVTMLNLGCQVALCLSPGGRQVRRRPLRLGRRLWRRRRTSCPCSPPATRPSTTPTGAMPPSTPLMAKSYAEQDPAKRVQILLHDAEAILMKERPVAPLMVNDDLWLVVQARCKGWQDNAANNHDHSSATCILWEGA